MPCRTERKFVPLRMYCSRKPKLYRVIYDAIAASKPNRFAGRQGFVMVGKKRIKWRKVGCHTEIETDSIQLIRRSEKKRAKRRESTATLTGRCVWCGRLTKKEFCRLDCYRQHNIYQQHLKGQDR